MRMTEGSSSRSPGRAGQRSSSYREPVARAGGWSGSSSWIRTARQCREWIPVVLMCCQSSRRSPALVRMRHSSRKGTPYDGNRSYSLETFLRVSKSASPRRWRRSGSGGRPSRSGPTPCSRLKLREAQGRVDTEAGFPARATTASAPAKRSKTRLKMRRRRIKKRMGSSS